MDKKLIIKLFKSRKKSCDNLARVIVVGYNTSKVNGRYIEKLGSFSVMNRSYVYMPRLVCSLKLRRVGFWLNKGASMRSKVSWLLGMLSLNDKENYK